MAPADPDVSPGRPLGCSRCRWSRRGCSRCRNPQFRPRASSAVGENARRALAARLATAAVRSSAARLAAVQDRRLRAGGRRGGSRDGVTRDRASAGSGAGRLSPVRAPSPVWPDLPKAPVTPPSSPDSSLGSFGSSVLAELQAFAAERGRGGEKGDDAGRGDAAVGDGEEEDRGRAAIGSGEEEDRGRAAIGSGEEEDRGRAAIGSGEEEDRGRAAIGSGDEAVEGRGEDGAHTPPAKLADNLGALRLAGTRRGREAVLGEGAAAGGADGASGGEPRELGPKRAKLERAIQNEGAEGGSETGAAVGDGSAAARSNGSGGTSDAVEPIGPAGAMTGRGDPNPRQTKYPRLSLAAGGEDDVDVDGRVAMASAGDAVGRSRASATGKDELREVRAGTADERSAQNSPPGVEPSPRTFASSPAPKALSPGRGSTPSLPTTSARKRRQPRREGEEDQVVGAEPPVHGGVEGVTPGRSTAVRSRLRCADRFSSPPSKRRRALPSAVAGARVSRWTPPASPWGLVEEELWRDPWRLLVACVLLNKTRGDAARKVLAALFRTWPTAEALVGLAAQREEPPPRNEAQREEPPPRNEAQREEPPPRNEAQREEPPPHNEALTLSRLAGLLQPLGLHRRRAASLLAMSRAYLQGDWVEARDLPGVGPYADDAFRIFCLGEWRETVPQDKDLKRYRDFLVETGGQGLGLQPPPEYWGGLGGGADAGRDAPTGGDAADSARGATVDAMQE